MVSGRLINCPDLLPQVFRAAANATAVALPDGSVGGLADFAQRTEAGRIQENRDKLGAIDFFERCHAENVRLNTTPRRRVLGIF